MNLHKYVLQIVNPSSSSKAASRQKRRQTIKQLQNKNKRIVEKIQSAAVQNPPRSYANVTIGTCSPTQPYSVACYVSPNYEVIEMSVREAENASDSVSLK